MTAQIRVFQANSAEEFIGLLLEKLQAPLRSIHRGEANVRWKLQPSAWRDGKISAVYDKHNVSDKLPLSYFLGAEQGGKSDLAVAEFYLQRTTTQDDVVRLRELWSWLRAEIEVVTEFCGACDRIALTVPGYNSTRSSIRIIDESWFTLGLKGVTNHVSPAFEIDSVFAFAQHNGLPTRLLDFSDNPLKAAYFAVMSQRETDFCVWTLHESIDGYADDRLRAEEFRALRSQIPSLHAQDGLFLSSNGPSNKYFLEHGRWPTLNETLGGWSIERLICPATERLKVRRLLNNFGINDLTMLPSYETVSRSVTNTLAIKG